MLVIGSNALQGLPEWRQPKDLDYICTPNEYIDLCKLLGAHNGGDLTRWGRALHIEGYLPIELEYTSTTGQKLLELLNIQEGTTVFPKPDVIYTLKMSHRFLKDSPHFHKTMSDILALRKLGCTIPDYLQDWYIERCKETYDYEHPKLNVDKDAFFTDNVKYIYDHDSVHEAVKLNDKPAYMYFKVGEVQCSKELFMGCPFNVQMSSVLEESYVLALERHQIPNNYTPDPTVSFLTALKKVCTSITSGWWREFAWEHYWDAVSLFDNQYVNKFKQGIKDGIVKPYSL